MFCVSRCRGGTRFLVWEKTLTHIIFTPPFLEFWDSVEHVELGEVSLRPHVGGLLEAFRGGVAEGDRTFSGPDWIDGENSSLELLA